MNNLFTYLFLDIMTFNFFIITLFWNFTKANPIRKRWVYIPIKSFRDNSGESGFSPAVLLVAYFSPNSPEFESNAVTSKTSRNEYEIFSEKF
jgi:hypothetical protein